MPLPWPSRPSNQGVWSQLPIWERAKVLNRFADLIGDNLEDLFRLETANNGRPIVETRAQISRLSGWYRYNAALLLADRTDVISMPGSYHSYTSRFPIGVVGILSSFNHPLMITSKSLAPGVGDRKLRRAQAVRADAVHLSSTCRPRGRRRDSGRSVKRDPGPRPHRRGATRGASRCRQSLVYRRHRARPSRRPSSCQALCQGHRRVGWQVTRHRV